MNIIPILFTFDQSLEMPAGVCITSLLENSEPDTFYDIFILHGPHCDFSSGLLNRLPEQYSEKCRIAFRKVEGEFVGGYEIRGIPETAYYRLISPELIPEYDKILYSDVDVIFREDLSKYYNTDIGDNYFAAVDNCSRLRLGERIYINEELGINWENGYYYSGNLVINSKQLLKDNKLDEFRALGKRNFLQQDMDIMNIVCNKRFYAFGPSFCMTVQLYGLIVNRRAEMEELFGRSEIEHTLTSGIVHYNGEKPWKGLCVNMDIWWEYYRRSIFFDEKFAYNFWNNMHNILVNLSFKKRLKVLLRYPLDRKQWK